jgi:3-hydroxyisobutyrate dehydrogenase-like beta-hydroxyacid dehydrogenase
MNIAFLGLGSMGSPMAGNLLKAGHKVTVWNRNPAATALLKEAGAVHAETPAAAARDSEIAITMLADDPAVDSVVLGSNGLAEGLAEGATHLSMSTISVALADKLATAHRDRGQHFVSAPVFGRPEAAAAAKLFIAAAGDPASIERVTPAFDAIGQRWFLVGETPSQANLVKLTGNFLISCVIEGMAEAFALTGKGGIPAETLYNVMTETLFSSPVYKTYGKILVDQAFSPPGFKLPLGMKDNRLVQEAGAALAVPLPFASIIRDRFLTSIAKGDSELDWSAIGKRAAEDAGLTHG